MWVWVGYVYQDMRADCRADKSDAGPKRPIVGGSTIKAANVKEEALKKYALAARRGFYIHIYIECVVWWCVDCVCVCVRVATVAIYKMTLFERKNIKKEKKTALGKNDDNN